MPIHQFMDDTKSFNKPKQTDDSSTTTTRRRARKKKEQQVFVSLYIQGVPYDNGKMCTFCEKSIAICYCPSCTDFHCEKCDNTVHSHAKRNAHDRFVLSLLTKEIAAYRCTFAMRYLMHLKRLQRLCRKKFRRLYDSRSFNHYYVNTVYNSTSWRKPYCLRHEELLPFLTSDEAAARIQGLHRMWKVRIRAIDLIHKFYSKIFDRRREKFYYAYTGPSTLIPRQSWIKPVLFTFRGYPKDLKAVHTKDYYALQIQRKWRVVLIKRFFCALVRKHYEQIWDPIGVRFLYINHITQEISQEKPLLLGSEAWNPNYVPDWDMARVIIFLRRLGLKQHVDKVLMYGLDGCTLLALEFEDYALIGIENRVQIKKILLELERIYPIEKRDLIGPEYLLRREKIRKFKQYERACLEIQRVFRGYVGRKYLKYLKACRDIQVRLDIRAKEVAQSATWWSEYKEQSNKVMKDVKLFGRLCDHQSVRGFGRWHQGEWKASAAEVEVNPGKKFTEKLARSGLDYRLQQKFFLRNKPPIPPPLPAVTAPRTSE